MSDYDYTSLSVAGKKLLIAAAAVESVIQSATVSALLQYSSVSEAEQRRDEAHALLDSLDDALLIICAGQSPVALYDNLRALRALINESISQQALSLPEVAVSVLSCSAPALVISQEIYGSADQTAALCAGFSHPLFLKGRLEYLKTAGSRYPKLVKHSGLVSHSAIGAEQATKGGDRQGLTHVTYDISGATHPVSHDEYQSIVDNYATPDNQFGAGVSLQVNGSGNPFGQNENYLTLFKGFIEISEAGDYGFAVDGDDAIELIINNTVVTGFYGGHRRAGVPKMPASIRLENGFHSIEFRHEQISGGSSYYLYWKPPGAQDFDIIPATSFSSDSN